MIMTESFNATQQSLIKQAELAHANGLRHSGLSGTICEDLLIRSLKKSLPNLNFSRGIIKFGDRNIIGADLKKDNLSTQFDVIVYKNQPIYQEAENVVVSSDDVLAVIEVKKWITLKMFGDLNANIGDILKNYRIKTKKDIAFFLVAFRCHDRHKGFAWWQEHVKILPTKFSFCFSGNYSSEDGRNLYPHEEKWWNDFGNYSYAGQYEKLVVCIKDLL